eukprot:362710-Chlamydomonas_euryale.AAC.1
MMEANLGLVHGKMVALRAVMRVIRGKWMTMDANLGLAHGKMVALRAVMRGIRGKWMTMEANLGLVHGKMVALREVMRGIRGKWMTTDANSGMAHGKMVRPGGCAVMGLMNDHGGELGSHAWQDGTTCEGEMFRGRCTTVEGNHVAKHRCLCQHAMPCVPTCTAGLPTRQTWAWRGHKADALQGRLIGGVGLW